MIEGDTLLLADMFENFLNVCLEIYEFINSVRFLTEPGLVWQAALKKTKVKLDLSTDNDILFMVQKGITGWICHTIHWYAKANDNCMKDYDQKRTIIS